MERIPVTEYFDHQRFTEDSAQWPDELYWGVWNGLRPAERRRADSIVPVLVVYLSFQKYFVEGMAGAVKQ